MEDFNKAYQEMIEKDKGKKLNDEKANFQNDSIKESGIARKTVDKKLEAQHGYNLYEYIRNDKQAIVDEVLSYLDQGADINFNLNDGCTILMEALSCKNYEIAELLIEKGANLDLQDKDGETALMLAIDYNNYKIAELLIEKGANLDLQDGYGDSALIGAIHYEYNRIAELLIEKGANLDLQNRCKSNALMHAISCKNYKMAELLIEKGANLALKDKAKFDALYYAKRSEEKTIIKLIEDNLKKQKKEIEKVY